MYIYHKYIYLSMLFVAASMLFHSQHFRCCNSSAPLTHLTHRNAQSQTHQWPELFNPGGWWDSYINTIYTVTYIYTHLYSYTVDYIVSIRSWNFYNTNSCLAPSIPSVKSPKPRAALLAKMQSLDLKSQQFRCYKSSRNFSPKGCKKICPKYQNAKPTKMLISCFFTKLHEDSINSWRGAVDRVIEDVSWGMFEVWGFVQNWYTPEV